MYFNQKYQERVSAQSEFENEIEQSIAIDNNIQSDREDSNNEQNYGYPHPQQEFYDVNEEFVERFD